VKTFSNAGSTRVEVTFSTGSEAKAFVRSIRKHFPNASTDCVLSVDAWGEEMEFYDAEGFRDFLAGRRPNRQRA